jgi:hypothetical protein
LQTPPAFPTGFALRRGIGQIPRTINFAPESINQSINIPTSTRRIEEMASERKSGFSLDFFASCAWTKLKSPSFCS